MMLRAFAVAAVAYVTAWVWLWSVLAAGRRADAVEERLAALLLDEEGRS